MPEPSRIRGALGSINRQPALLSTIRRLRRRLPGDPEFGDALSTAGTPTLAYLVQGVDALSPERNSVVSEVSLTSLQLWQSLSEAAGRGRGDLELALLYADIVDSSSLALAAGDAVTVDLLRRVATILERCVEAHGGRIVRRMGDGVIATFISAQAAVEAALDIQDAVLDVEVGEGTGHSAGGEVLPGRPGQSWRVQLRTGVHWGRPRRLAGEYVGAEVTIVAAIGEGARPGQVLVSAPALAQLDPAFHELRIGRRKRLRSDDAPAELQVSVVRRG